uniref:Alpha-amylase n=1 Tax=Mesoaciditoga lauensis TaxID=1495039 RepID=A0A7V3RDT8_9BACT
MEWWKEGTFYQIYPRSFKDSNGDGIGDLKGITEKLDYFEWLGIDALWICPFFKSPMADFGYDISDYTGVDPLFGTIDDFKELLNEAHERKLKIVIDQVYNHTSDEHPWFVESRSSKNNSKADWYIWREPKADGSLPNNWISLFSGDKEESVWTWDENRRQYYLHLFAKEQPDLNWQNEDLRKAIYDSMKFWLDMGVDGFRFDAASQFYKDIDRDVIEGPQVKKSLFESVRDQYYWDPFTARPETLLEVEKLRNIMDSYKDKVSVGEISSDMGLCLYLFFTLPKRFNIAFNIDFLEKLSMNPQKIKELAEPLDELFGTRAWPSYVTGNHDNRRIVSRMTDGTEMDSDEKSMVSKLFATLLLTLRGTPFIYYGEEIGMEDTVIPYERVMDPWGKALWPKKGRDPSRTPMQWNYSKYAGFSTVEPWLPVNENKSNINVESEMKDPSSVLNFYRALLKIRRSYRALTIGKIDFLEANEDLLIYKREDSGKPIFVILNFKDVRKNFSKFDISGNILLSSEGRKGSVSSKVDLYPFESLVVEGR